MPHLEKTPISDAYETYLLIEGTDEDTDAAYIMHDYLHHPKIDHILFSNLEFKEKYLVAPIGIGFGAINGKTLNIICTAISNVLRLHPNLKKLHRKLDSTHKYKPHRENFFIATDEQKIYEKLAIHASKVLQNLGYGASVGLKPTIPSFVRYVTSMPPFSFGIYMGTDSYNKCKLAIYLPDGCQLSHPYLLKVNELIKKRVYTNIKSDFKPDFYDWEYCKNMYLSSFFPRCYNYLRLNTNASYGGMCKSNLLVICSGKATRSTFQQFLIKYNLQGTCIILPPSLKTLTNKLISADPLEFARARGCHIVFGIDACGEKIEMWFYKKKWISASPGIVAALYSRVISMFFGQSCVFISTHFSDFTFALGTLKYPARYARVNSLEKAVCSLKHLESEETLICAFNSSGKFIGHAGGDALHMITFLVYCAQYIDLTSILWDTKEAARDCHFRRFFYVSQNIEKSLDFMYEILFKRNIEIVIKETLSFKIDDNVDVAILVQKNYLDIRFYFGRYKTNNLNADIQEITDTFLPRRTSRFSLGYSFESYKKLSTS